MGFGRLNLGIGKLGNKDGVGYGWILPGASIDLDFANNRYLGGTSSSLLSITRASNKTDLLPSSSSGASFNTFTNNNLALTPTKGLLIEESRTNLLLNSQTPITQTTGSLGTGSYTLWVNGSGSALASAGTATITGAASATNGSPNTFSVTAAGTVTITVTGSLNAFQLEAGSFGTSFIVTAGVTATRAADNISPINAFATLINGSADVSILAQTGTTSSATVQNTEILFAGNSTHHWLVSLVSNTTVSARISPTNITATFGTGSFSASSVIKSGVSYSLSGNAVSTVVNNGTVATGTLVYSGENSPFLGSTGGNSYYNGYIARVSLWNSKLPDATLKAFTQ